MAKKQKQKRNLVTIGRYAEMCGITKALVYSRISEGEIKTVTISDRMFIDLDTTPVVPAKRRGPKSSEEILKNS